MIDIQVDRENNRAMIKMSGNVSYEEAGQSIKKVFEACRDLEDDFSIINDISNLQIRSEEELRTLNKVHLKMSDSFKIGKVIRVIGKSKSILIKLSKIDKEFNLKNIHYVPTMMEAVALFDKTKEQI